MKKKLKGGVEGIIALIILTGIVIGLIAYFVIPMVNGTKATGQAGTDRISGLADAISGDEEEAYE